MTSCLNYDYLILNFIHFSYLIYENPSFIIVSAETEYFWTRQVILTWSPTLKRKDFLKTSIKVAGIN